MTGTYEITEVLRDLTDGNEQIRASMVVKRGLDGIVIFPDSFKEEVTDIWEPLSKGINDMLGLVDKYGSRGMRSAYLDFMGYIVFFDVFEGSDTALVAFFKGPGGLLSASEAMEQIKTATNKILTIIEGG